MLWWAICQIVVLKESWKSIEVENFEIKQVKYFIKDNFVWKCHHVCDLRGCSSIYSAVMLNLGTFLWVVYLSMPIYSCNIEILFNSIYFNKICCSISSPNMSLHICSTPMYPCTVRPTQRKPINQVNFSENWNDLSENVYIVTKFNLSSFFWHQLPVVLAMHDQARTISNGDVRIDLRRIWI